MGAELQDPAMTCSDRTVGSTFHTNNAVPASTEFLRGTPSSG